MWKIEDGILVLFTQDGGCYKPSSKDLYEQKDKDAFIYKEVSYPSLSTLDIRISTLFLQVTPQITFDDTINLKLIATWKGCEYLIPIVDGHINDYIIIDNVLRFASQMATDINFIIDEYNLDILSLTYPQYIILTRELTSRNISFVDKVSRSVEAIKASEEYDKPQGLQANLYPYQLSGSKWLEFMTTQRCGCILGDEMGLGKTLQIIAVMGKLKNANPNVHCLVVCPVSLLENWRREIEKFYPSLSTYIHYGPKRTGDYRVLLEYDVTIMAFSGALTDGGMLTMIEWDLLVVDEAQIIKNHQAKRTKALKSINCDVPIAVTGTPFENHMTDVWSLIDFVLPGFLGNLSQFERSFPDDIDSASRLEKLITPLLLRRRVKDVAKDLPERIDIPQPLIMTPAEAMLYEGCRTAEDDSMEELKSMQLAKIQKLRTFCTHPCVYQPNYMETDPTSLSTKYERLVEILDEIFESGEKVIVFTSFRLMIEMLTKDIHDRYGVYTNFIDGTTVAQERQKIVDEFSAVEGPGALMLNPKAAGAGLNITCANHVIHYNLEWNPAVEDQASARAYRKGQDKTVFVHRLYYVNTIEEIINEKIENKRLLSGKAIVGNNGGLTDQEYLIKALQVSPYNN